MDLSVARLQDLFQTLSTELSDVRTLSETQGYAVERFRSRLKKKARLGDATLREKAVADFKATNTRVANWTVTLEPFIEHNARVFIAEAFERYNARNDDSLIQVGYDYRNLQKFWRFGPGASNGVKGTHAADKFCQPMTCTPASEPLVRRLRQEDPYFRAYDLLHGTPVEKVDGSRLTTVPKNEETDRTIAIEPSGNMALQLALGCYIEDVLRSIGLDITKQQPQNQRLARLGSIDGSFATIDLSKASDSISIALVRKLFPAGVYDTMLRLRSDNTTLPSGESVRLEMMSTMGNGFTFPMMTFIFVALIYATELKYGGPSRFVDWETHAVFGDDLIVPNRLYEPLSRVLNDAGFVVNHDKSFHAGAFRESCGGDYYKGENVTPVYVKKLANDSDVYVAMNQLAEWSARVNYDLSRSITLLASFLKHPETLYFVPEWHGDDAGFRTTLVSHRYTYLRVKQEYRRWQGDPLLAMPLVLAGYVEHMGPSESLFFLPRPYKTRYRVTRTRLPRGYLDGRDPLTRSSLCASRIDYYAFLLRLIGK